MRKLKTCSRRGLPFRLLVIVAGALLLLAAFAPSANADLLRFYDFEGPPNTAYPVNLDSHAPALETGFTLTLESTTNNIPYPVINTLVGPPIQQNLPPGAPPSTISLGIQRAGVTNLNMEMPFISATGIYDIDSVSFAVGSNGNGFLLVGLQISTDGGTVFNNIPGVPTQPVPLGTGTITFTVPDGTTQGIPNLVLRLNFTLGQSNGANLQTIIDNLQVNGTAVPEPATVAGGLLGVLGLCWFQRRRLIRSVRFRRT